MLLPIIVGIILVLAIATFLRFRYPAPSTGNSSNEEQENFIETYVFPRRIEQKVKEQYSHLTEQQISQVLTGLQDFFHACQQASRIIIGMPSQVVDVAWHEFILDTREYQYFCERAFDRFLHHTPAEAMPSEGANQEGLRRAWQLTCRREGIDPKSPTRLPLLFALDSTIASIPRKTKMRLTARNRSAVHGSPIAKIPQSVWKLPPPLGDETPVAVEDAQVVVEVDAEVIKKFSRDNPGILVWGFPSGSLKVSCLHRVF
ncbi:hypothetical protein [Candidatus Nitronereus thalassa]|uniref:Uncharacterized protein n=1 Tax=Candidatus Nitronereus thalassa TaxID=3020898 RepID=A0ABU3K4I3_9BACT|nr:hypothetical protein [Candidatus Nitronereus thalassa]MDT7041325.1 hypothetical protein [Candidatus Nitronereus thalassa]